jgi:putative ATPase
VSDLFSRAAVKDRRGQPLAERMRPRRLSEVVGQAQLLGPGTWLVKAILSKRLTSVILWGPPGVGKTTLGRLIAEEIDADFVSLSAVMSGVKDLREAVAQAESSRNLRGRRTLLFVDEIHRFNKAQQDALLPHVEAGTVTLVGATTENPSFEVNAALLSRAKVLVLKALAAEDLETLLERALTDKERGLGSMALECAPNIVKLIAAEARGDARRALSTLESAATVNDANEEGVHLIDRRAVEEALQRKTLLYDKAGDEHFAVASALIKSLRGSDPDASVYWLARMVESGEDPMFIMRRLVIFASEDVGNADPRALAVAVSAMEAARFIGFPEALYPLTQATLYLALAPKSNSALTAFAAAKEAVHAHGGLGVPVHLRNASTGLQRQLGHGKEYQYPHDHVGHHVVQQYLPAELRHARFFAPSDQGEEPQLAAAHNLRKLTPGESKP